MSPSAEISKVARRSGLSPEAIGVLFDALVRGGGSQAQFSHPELGGHGQWMSGGMLMIGDMFNDALKAKVADACLQLAPLAAQELANQPRQQVKDAWWPESLGHPGSVASQDSFAYALFGDRIAVRTGAKVTIYAVGNNIASGVGMSNGKLSVLTASGSIPLEQLPIVN